MQALLKDLAKRKEELARLKKPTPKTGATVKPMAPKAFVLAAISQQLQLQKLAAMVKQQLADCWSIPGGVKDVHEIKVGGANSIVYRWHVAGRTPCGGCRPYGIGTGPLE